MLAQAGEDTGDGEDVRCPAYVPVEDAVGRRVEESLQREAGAGGDGPDLLGEVEGERCALQRRAGHDGDESRQALAGRRVADGHDGPGGRLDEPGDRKVGGDPPYVREAHVLHVDEVGPLGRVGHLEHVAVVDQHVEVALAGQRMERAGLDAPVGEQEAAHLVDVETRRGGVEDAVHASPARARSAAAPACG